MRPAFAASSKNVAHGHYATSTRGAVKAWLPKAIKTKSMLDVLTIPAVPDVNRRTLSSRLQRRQEKTKGREDTPAARTEALRKLLAGAVTGWGEDKLAPPGQSRRDATKDPKQEASKVKQFEHDAYHPHGASEPLFDRRLQLWIADNGIEPTLQRLTLDEPQPSVPQLSPSLSRVLFNAGPHWLRDPRSQVHNFDPWLETLPDIHDFDFGRTTPYVTSSRDETLLRLAKREGKRFAGSTSSLSGLLSHIYFLISGGRGVDTSILSSAFANEPSDFTYGARWPGGIILRPSEGIYRVDSQEMEDPEKHLLLNMGTMLEKFLTHSPEDFALLQRSSPLSDDLQKLQKPEAYKYSKSDKFIMRAQLDAHDSRLPGSGVFDIKTRAAVAIRYDPLNYKQSSGYQIRTLQGAFESFEREHYDLIRAAFLKYGFQVRIGGMDGIFVAYHNTATMFGFQYFSRDDMDERLFGGAVQGDRVFDKCVKCMEEILSEATQVHPGVPVNCWFETSQTDGSLRMYVEPQEWQSLEESTPVTELLITATNYLNGRRILGPMNFGEQTDEWKVLLSVTRSSSASDGMNASVKKERDALVERKNAFNFWLPPGVSPTEMAERWLKTDYTTGAQSRDEEKISALASDGYDEEELALLKLRFEGRQRPSDFVASLRKLARGGTRSALDDAGNMTLSHREGRSEDAEARERNFRNMKELLRVMSASPPRVEGLSKDSTSSSTVTETASHGEGHVSQDAKRFTGDASPWQAIMQTIGGVPPNGEGLSQDPTSGPTVTEQEDKSHYAVVEDGLHAEQGSVEPRVEIGVPVDETSVHVKEMQEVEGLGNLSGGEAPLLRVEEGGDVDSVGEVPENNQVSTEDATEIQRDKITPPALPISTTSGAEGETDQSEPADILGSEERQQKLLDPMIQKDDALPTKRSRIDEGQSFESVSLQPPQSEDQAGVSSPSTPTSSDSDESANTTSSEDATSPDNDPKGPTA